MKIGFPGTGTVARHARSKPAGPERDVPVDRRNAMSESATDLAYRRGAGIEVTLLWDRADGELTVSVTDATSGTWFELPISPDEALAVFNHPYAYAAVKGVAC
jgi:hypothetical protein